MMNINALKSFVILLLIAMHSASIAHSEVWTARNEWDISWEEKYADWIISNVTTDFLVPIQLKVDCADLCYVVRAIFSRINHLPFIAHDYQGNAIDHESSSWDDHSTHPSWQKDKRFRAFLQKLTVHVTTDSFKYDTYPVELNPKTVQPGLLIYEDIVASHACFIGRIKPNEIIPVKFFESTVPPRMKFHQTTSINIYIYSPKVDEHHSGIVRWKWPVKKGGKWQYVPNKEMPYFSREIYRSDFSYRKSLSKPLNRIVKKSHDPSALLPKNAIRELVHLFHDQVEFRNKIIQEGWKKLKKKPELKKDESFEFNYSTHSRDQRLHDAVSQIWFALEEYDLPQDCFYQALDDVSLSISESHSPVTLLDLFIATNNRWISSEACHNPPKRWGLAWNAENQMWLFNGEQPCHEVKSRYLEKSFSK